MARSAEEMLYLAMEDFRIDIMVGKGAGATSVPLDLAPFTLVGATTRAGLLPNPLRDRFGFTAHLEFYDEAELEQVLARAASLLETRRRPRGPRRDRRPLPRNPAHRQPPAASRARLRARARFHGAGRRGGRVDLAAVRAALELYDVDPLGLDRLDRAVMQIILTRFDGGRRPQHPRGLGGRGGRDHRGRRRAVPRAHRPHHAHAAGPGRDDVGVAALRARRSRARGCSGPSDR